MLSMTGYATITSSLPTTADQTAELSITLKSVNSRFFDANVRTPHIISSVDATCIKVLRKLLKRGSVSLQIRISKMGAFIDAIEPNVELAAQYLQAATRLKHMCDVSGEITVLDLMKLPDVLSKQEFKLSDTHKQSIVALVEQAAQKLLEERQKEGAVLQKDILERIAILSETITVVKKQVALIFDERSALVEDKVKALCAKSTDQQITEALRMAFQSYIDKLDVTEELVRFESHLQNFSDIVASDSIEKGKKLDFVTQELFREANTIAAKCGHGTTSKSIITIKSELEKIREQLQNIV